MEKSNEEKFKFTQPFLKWVGGKQKFIEKILEKFPKEIKNYHEIFLGGGSVLLGLIDYKNNNKINLTGKIFAYDYNKELIYVFKNIQNTPVELFKELSLLREEFINIKKEKQEEDYKKEERKRERKKYKNEDDRYTYDRKYVPKNLEEAVHDKESYYFWIRDKFNKMEEENKLSIKGSAMFIFLNKTCFRGLYRVGPNGFNVPYGNYKNFNISEEKYFKNISKLIKDVEFIHCDFSKSIKRIKKNDFAYLDPPYAPEKKDSFTSYTGEGFNLDKHNELFKLCNELESKKFLMSNSNVDFDLSL